MWRRFREFVLRTDAHPDSAGRRRLIPVCGGIAGLSLFVWSEQLVCLLGTSTTVAATMSAALAIGILFGSTVLPHWPRRVMSASTALGVLQLLLAAQAVAMPWLLDTVNAVISQPGLMGLHGSGRNAGILSGICLVLLGVPAGLISCSVNLLQGAGSPVPHTAPHRFFFGIAAGVVMAGGLLAPWLGLQYTALAGAALGVSLGMLILLRRSDDIALAAPDTTTMNRTSLREMASRLVALLCVGSLTGLVVRLLDQLFPTTIYSDCAAIAGPILGIVCGLSWQARCNTTDAESGPRRRLLLCLAAATSCVLLVAAFPLLILAALWLTAHVSSPGLLLAARGMIIAISLFPIGLAAAACSTAVNANSGAASSASYMMKWLCPLFGYWLAAAWLVPQLGMVVAVTICTWLCLTAAAVAWLRRADLPQQRLSQATIAVAVALVAAAPIFSSSYRPDAAAKTLFNTRVFMAYRSGIKPALLTALDEGRMIDIAEGSRGTLTVWKYGVHQLHLRENGMPKGAISSDPALFPQFAPELLQAALPLTLHERPERMLVLGLGSGEALSAGLLFPLQQIVCIEDDAALIRLVRDVLRRESPGDPFDDDRLKIKHGDPVLTAGLGQGKFDVVVSVPDQPALGRTQASLCREYYLRAAQSLAADGVFCQRLQYIDLGPGPVRVLTQTLRSVFADLMAIEVAPGEMLLLATNSKQGLLRPKLVSRLQRMHVRQALAEVGLDWSVLLNLAALNSSSLEQFAAGTALSVNTAATGRLACELPREVARWSAKLDEMQVATANKAGRILNWLPEEETGPDIVRRLAEIKGQQELMTQYADQYWAYRASVRNQLTNNQRSPIRQVSLKSESERVHPEDRRRLNYFSALGRAVKSGTADDIRLITEFETPYDPLLSYFLHREVAELFSQSKERPPAEELRHRLHSTYFTSPRDGSVKNVVDALNLVQEHPEAEPDATRRWDTLNALLQSLQFRWEARIGVRPKEGQSVVNDIDQTIAAAERTFAVMDSLTAEAGLPAEQWSARKAVFGKSLIRPLQAYRADVLPHVLRSKVKKSATADAPQSSNEPE